MCCRKDIYKLVDRRMQKTKLFLVFLLFTCCITAFAQKKTMISGKIVSTDKGVVEFATVYLKGTNWGCSTNEQGIYHLEAPAGEYILVVSAIGFETVERDVKLIKGERVKETVVLKPEITELEGVDVVTSGVSRVNKSAYNVVAIDLKSLHNSTQSLATALMKAPGVKLRESGGVGSDVQLSLDGFSGKYVKVFIDGVPQEGAGTSFDLNNIPVNFAERIEVYRGVVPVGFGTDALGGVINIVTNKRRRSWYLDASYSYGSFNTHKSYVDFGQTFRNGVTYGINAYQNYSDNNYYIENTVQEFDHSDNSMKPKEEILRRVKRFNDAFHNEAVLGKFGVVGKSWADRLVFGFAYSHFYKEIQNGVYQDDVFGEKHRHGYSFVPSMEFQKSGLFT